MEKTFSKIVMVVLAALFSLHANAYVKIGGFYYELDSKKRTAEVTSGVVQYSGDIVIPGTCMDNGVTYTVTSIGDAAFSQCKDITSVKIPESVTYIGSYAFAECKGLKSVYIPNSVVTIIDAAFQDCSGLVSLTIGDGVNYIGDAAFKRCNSLTSIIVSEKNKTYDSRGNCNAIIETSTNTLLCGCKKTVIPDGVESIGDGAFEGTKGLASITIPESVKTIGEDAFLWCSDLTSVTIGKGVTSIGNWAFSGCSGLNEVYCYAENAPTMGNNVFQSVEMEKTILHVPAASIELYNVVTVWKNFENITTPNIVYYEYDKDAQTAKVIGNINGYSGDVVIPESVKHEGVIYQVTSLGMYAFQICNGPISVVIPNSVKEINSYTFYGCSELTSVTMPESVTSIGEWAFYGCSALTSVTIPEDVTIIGKYAFSGCGELRSITIPAGVVSIEEGTFQNCKKMSSVNIPNGVTHIRDFAFSCCECLNGVRIPSSVISIGDRVFRGDHDLFDISVDENNPVYDSRDNCGAIIETATNTLIRGCGLAEDAIPEGVTCIGDYAFAGCTYLTSVLIPKSVTSIGIKAFEGCIDLREIICNTEKVPETDITAFDDTEIEHTYLDIPPALINAYKATEPWKNFGNLKDFNTYEFDLETKTATVTKGGCKWGRCDIPEFVESDGIIYSVTSIKYDAFSDNSNMGYLTIPNSVVSIGGGAFRFCEFLHSVIIGNGVTFIGDHAFWGCSRLRDVYCYAENPPTMGNNVFGGHWGGVVIENAILHVPAASIRKYKVKAPWNSFANIVAIPEIVPMEEGAETGFDKSITAETDLTDIVIDNVYVTLDTKGSDGYDTEEKCIVLTSTMTDDLLEYVADMEVGDATLQDYFNGLIFEVPAGKGTISIEVQTKGSRVLSVKIGDGEVWPFVQPERGVVNVPYTATESTYVYIYGTATSASAQCRAISSDAENGVLIYGVKWKGVATDMNSVVADDGTYQIYTADGKQVDALQQGVNILHYSNGQTKKVLVK